jgi:hypothetical protein
MQRMTNELIATYLNDHLAGSVVALELLEFLERTYPDPGVTTVLAEVRADVAVDREQLELLMARLDIARSRSRRATAWLVEKLNELKLRLDDREGRTLRLLEGVEAVAIGIDGKRALWRALAVTADVLPALRGPDYDRLVQRAADQRARIEAVRLDAARAAFGATPQREGAA